MSLLVLSEKSLSFRHTKKAKKSTSWGRDWIYNSSMMHFFFAITVNDYCQDSVVSFLIYNLQVFSKLLLIHYFVPKNYSPAFTKQALKITDKINVLLLDSKKNWIVKF